MQSVWAMTDLDNHQSWSHDTNIYISFFLYLSTHLVFPRGAMVSKTLPSATTREVVPDIQKNCLIRIWSPKGSGVYHFINRRVGLTQPPRAKVLDGITTFFEK